jgi:heme-degrading monooxygenase HmoA
MTHLRLWRFEVPADRIAQFVAAYEPDGDWGRLFATAPGFLRTELWRGSDGSFLTADHWQSLAAFERFQAERGDDYRRLDAKLEGIASAETFLGAFDTA